MSSYCIVYSIAGISFAIKSNYEIVQTSQFQNFISTSKAYDYEVELEVLDKLQEQVTQPLTKGNEYKVCFDGREYLRYYYEYGREDKVYAVTRWDWDAHKIIVYYLLRGQEFLSQSGNVLFHLGLEMTMLREKRLIFHAACVDTLYGGVLFAGASGSGKSTQAELWMKYKNARLINGDRPILSKEESGWKAWGAPYAGSSKCYVNDWCSVSAIVLVVQDSANKVVRLNERQAFSTVYSGITLNDWSREDVNLACDLVEALVDYIPVYELHCTKEKEAVDVLAEVLGEGKKL